MWNPAQPKPGRAGLGRFFDVVGGITQDDALSRAETNLSVIREDVLAEMDRTLGRIGRLLAECSAVMIEHPYVSLIENAHAIHGVAGTFGFGSLGETAFMMREYLQNLMAVGGWDQIGLQSFLDVMRRLHKDSSTKDFVEVVGALQEMVRRRSVDVESCARL